MPDETSRSNYQWLILALAALTHTFVVAMPSMCMPVLFSEIEVDLGLSHVQVGAIWGVGSAAGMLTGLIGGSLGDRFGTKRTLVWACLLAGTAGALRGFSTDLYTLAATFFLFGFLTPAIPMNVHKVCGIWFSRQRLGLANGVASTGMALGFALGSLVSATYLSPWLGGWENVLFFYGAISIVICVLWSLTRTAPAEREQAASSEGTARIRQAFSHVVRIRNIWYLGFAMMGLGACIQGMIGYLSLYLRDIGWTPANADGALTAFHTISLICAIPIALASDRLGLRKTILVVGAVMSAAGIGLLSVVDGWAIWAVVLMAGVFRDGFMAVLMTVIIELEGVGPRYAGTAMGAVGLFSRISGLISPPLGNSLAETDPALPFVFWAILGFSALWGLYMFSEERRVVAAPGMTT